MFEIERIAAEMRSTLQGTDPHRVTGRDALRLVRAAAKLERLAGAAKALYARRCVETGVWATDRDARVPAVTPAEWLADVSGSALGPARDALAVSEVLHDGSPTDRALRSGELSLTAAREVTAAGAVGGDAAERRVLRKATTEGLRAAKIEATRVLATAPDADERAARIHRQRSRRQWTTRDGIWNLALSGPVALGAEIEACLAPFHDAAWDAAATQAKDQRDTPDAIAFDGLLGMARAARDGRGRPESTKPRGRAKTRDHVVVHADATALVSGEVRDGERCEIPGVGPVPVEHARAMLGGGPLGNAILTILVEAGEDVRTFARPGRNVTRRLAQLLEARSPVCSITGCGRAARLENDHGTPVRDGGESSNENVDPLCRPHHRKKTDGWVLRDHPDGTRTLEPPPGMQEADAA